VEAGIQDPALFNVYQRKGNRMFKTNVGGIDRVLRIVAGLVLIGLTLMGTIGPWGWIGVVPLATGLLGSCLLYSIVGVNTCPTKAAK
jgi:hypothetical protein